LPTQFKRTPRTIEEIATAPDLALSTAYRNYTQSEPGCSCQSRLKDNPLPPDCSTSIVSYWDAADSRTLQEGKRGEPSAQQPQGCHLRRISFSGVSPSFTQKTIFLRI